MTDSQTNISVDTTIPVKPCEPWRYHATALADFAPARSFHYAPARLGVVFNCSLITVCDMEMVGLHMKVFLICNIRAWDCLGYLELMTFTLATAQNLLKLGLRRD